MFLAFLGCIIWSALDKRKEYEKADYWMRTSIRYFVAMNALLYGTIKLFALQMPFPNLSQLATPLGDYLPMRLSWMFMGYSVPYQMFTGSMETVAGLLLLNRKTVTLGLLFAAGVFANVFVMNLAYDIPVKIFSGHLLFYSIFLLAQDGKRLIGVFILNQASAATQLYHFAYVSKRMRIARVVAKIVFVGNSFSNNKKSY